MARTILLIVLALALVAGGAVAVLFATAPSPRQAPGWTLGPPLPSARGELAMAVAHASPCPEPPCPHLERLYAIGGLAGLGAAQDRVDVFDPGAGTWREAPPLPQPRHHLGAAGLGQAVYVAGGTPDRTMPWAPTADFWRLDAGAGAAAWEWLDPMPEPRWGHRLVEHDGRLFVVGGHGPSSRMLIYSPGAGWRAGAAMPEPRHHVSVVVVNGEIWAIGGRAPRSLARVDVYDPAADAWRPGPALPAPTSGAAEGVIDGVILVLGGEEDALWRGEVFDRHWMLDTRAAEPEWRPIPSPPLAVHGTEGAVFQGTMVLAGGAGRHGLLSVTAWADAVQWMERPGVRE